MISVAHLHHYIKHWDASFSSYLCCSLYAGLLETILTNYTIILCYLCHCDLIYFLLLPALHILWKIYSVSLSNNQNDL